MFEEEENTELPDGEVSEAETEAQEWAALEAQANKLEVGRVTVDGELVPQVRSAEVLQPLLAGGFAVMAPNWDVSPEETEALAEAWGNCLDAFFPSLDVDPRVAAVLGAVTTTALVVGPRWHQPRNEKERRQAEKQRQEPLPAKPEAPQKPVEIRLD